MNLFVANIHNSVKEDALKALFSEFGEVLSVKIMIDRMTGYSKGFGFIEMSNDAHAQQAIQKLSNAEFFGRKLVVSKAKAKAG
jgi:RNA recognition motif-containing protein